MLGVISLVVSIIALLPLCAFLSPVSIIMGIIGAALGFVARNQIQQRGQGGMGLALAGLIIGILAAVLGLAEFAGCAALIGLSATATPTP